MICDHKLITNFASSAANWSWFYRFGRKKIQPYSWSILLWDIIESHFE